MNNLKVKEILSKYKQHFQSIHNEEIYKWRALKCFQDHWDINAEDFTSILDRSFSKAKNLLDSGKYFPKKMLHHNAALEPVKVRDLFLDLYNEDNDLIERMSRFKNGIKTINEKYFPGKNHFQDDRAILVYLCLRYPDRYYFYKFKMFETFVQLVDYPYKPKRGSIQNILMFQSLCDIIKGEVIKDNELIELHKTRIKEDEFLDTSFNVLIQDIIYAAVKHIDKFAKSGSQDSAINRLIKVAGPMGAKNEKVVLKGSFTNFIENEKENKRIGDLGELLVLQFEQEKLNSLGIKKNPEHKSKSEGDGLGYDILSYDENENEIFIEVKTTKNSSNTPFYITRNELIRSQQDSEKFFLYRLHEFDDCNNKAKYYTRQGELTELCTNPTLFKAILHE